MSSRETMLGQVGPAAYRRIIKASMEIPFPAASKHLKSSRKGPDSRTLTAMHYPGLQIVNSVETRRPGIPRDHSRSEKGNCRWHRDRVTG